MFELKRISVSERLSEETLAFAADIWLDGKKVGSVDNMGCGGPNRYGWIDQEAGKKIEAWAAAHKLEFDFEQLDCIIGEMMEKHQLRKKLARYAKKTTLFRLAGDKKGDWRTIKAAFSPAVEAHIRSKYPAVECIANVDLDAALSFCQ